MLSFFNSTQHIIPVVVSQEAEDGSHQHIWTQSDLMYAAYWTSTRPVLSNERLYFKSRHEVGGKPTSRGHFIHPLVPIHCKCVETKVRVFI